MPKIRFGFNFDSYRLPLINIASTQRGDLYFAFPFSSSGLHMSLHESGKAHIKDNFGFFEPIDLNMPKDLDISELKSYLRKVSYNPDHGEDVLVISYPESFNGTYAQQFSNKNMYLDFMPLLTDTLTKTPLYQVPVETLPKYFQASPLETHIIIDETNNSFAIYNKRIRISLNFSMEESTVEKQIESMPFLKHIMQPMKKAIDHSNELASQGKIQISPQNIPKKIESNIDLKLNQLYSKIKIKKFI